MTLLERYGRKERTRFCFRLHPESDDRDRVIATWLTDEPRPGEIIKSLLHDALTGKIVLKESPDGGEQ